MSAGRRLGAAYADEVGPQHVGRRVTIRHEVSDGVTDVVGVLRSWDEAGRLAVERRDGSMAELTAETIVASRLIPDPPVRRPRRG